MGLALHSARSLPRAQVAQATAAGRPRTLRERFAKGEVEWSPELARVLAQPRRTRPELELLAHGLTQALKRPGGQQTLREVQAWALAEGPMAGGLVGLIQAGGGKTLIGCLMPMVWPHIRQPDGTTRPPRAVLLIPADLRVQFKADWERYRQHWLLPNLAGSGDFNAALPTLHVVAYSELQQPKNSALLEQLQPDLLMGDEISALANFESARCIRARRFLADFSETSFCGWDATLTADSIEDCWHFFAWAFDVRSPMPLEVAEVRRWAKAIDPHRKDDYFMPGALEQLCAPGEPVRSGFHRRLVDTLGVVSSDDKVLNIPLIFKQRRAPTVPDEIVEALKVLRRPHNQGGWRRPDGEELTEAVEVVACARQLACGFFLRWRFPRGEPPELIDDWFDKRQAYNRELRAQLLTPQVHLDSPKLCANAAQRFYAGGCPGCDRGPQEQHRPDCREQDTHPLWHAYTWPAWSEIEDKVYHETEAVWLSDYLLVDAAAWAAEAPGIVWTERPEFGERLSERTGLPFFAGGDQSAAELEARFGPEAGRASHSIIASVKANERGKNLQYAFSRNLLVSFPASNKQVEQVIGRTFRPFQTADRVEVDYYLHTLELQRAFDTAKERARAAQETFGQAQKLMYGQFERAA